MSAATVILARERKLVDRFRAAGATTPVTARPLADVGAGANLPFRRLCRSAVLREAAPGAYYLDELSWSAHRWMRLRIVTVVLTIAALLALLAFGILWR